MKQVFSVPSIKCEGCAESISKALGGLTGVQGTQVGIPEKEVRVEFDPAQVDEDRLRGALTQAGFPPA